MIVIDVGAGDGSQFAVAQANDPANAVYAIEADAERAATLIAQPHPNLQGFQQALTSENGTASQRLEDFIQQQALGDIDLLRLGHPAQALAVLQGAGKAIHQIRHIMLDAPAGIPLGAAATDVSAYLHQRGFRLADPKLDLTTCSPPIDFVRVTRHPQPPTPEGNHAVVVPHLGLFHTPPGDHVGLLLEEGVFENYEQAFLWLYLQPGDTLLDCGTHAGLFSAIAAQRLQNQGRIVGFEPNPVCLDLYRQNLDRLGCQCYTALNLALSDQAGQAELLMGDMGMAAYSTLAPGAQSHDQIGGKTLPVAQTPLDAVMAEHQIGPVTLAKLDVEGWEAHVLQGAEVSIQAGLLPLWMVEFTEVNAETVGSTTQALRTLLERYGYTLCRFDSTHFQLRPEPYHPQYPYQNLFAVQHLDQANQRLAAASPAQVAIARDLIAQGDTHGEARDLRRSHRTLVRKAQDLQRWAEQTEGFLAEEKAQRHTYRQWAESTEAKLVAEHEYRKELTQWVESAEARLVAERQRSTELLQWAESAEARLVAEHQRSTELLQRAESAEARLAAEEARLAAEIEKTMQVQHQLDQIEWQLQDARHSLGLLKTHLSSSRLVQIFTRLGLSKLGQLPSQLP